MIIQMVHGHLDTNIEVLKPSQLKELFFSPHPVTLTDFHSDEITRDQWCPYPLKWLQVSLQGYMPRLICRGAPVGPWHPLISRQERTSLSVQKFHFYFWVMGGVRNWQVWHLVPTKKWAWNVLEINRFHISVWRSFMGILYTGDLETNKRKIK